MSQDTLLHRGLRRPVGMLVHTRITPDMLTALRLLTALLAAVCFIHAGRLMAAGAGWFLLSALLDRADGELARQSRRFSRIGRHFDFAADCLAAMSIFLGLGIGVGSSLPVLPRAHLELGLSGALSVAAIFLLVYALEAPTEPAAGRASRPFDPDDVMLLLPLVIWCGGAGWIVLASGTVTPLVAIGVWLVTLMRRGAAATPSPAPACAATASVPVTRPHPARSRVPRSGR